MVDNDSIRNKFAEFYTEYENHNIDDFDTFVCARVAEYFINNEHISTDTIYAAIEKALCGPIIEETVTEETINSIEPKKPKRCPQCDSQDSFSNATESGYPVWKCNTPKCGFTMTRNADRTTQTSATTEFADEVSRSDVLHPQPVPQVSLSKKLLKAAPYIVGAGTAVIGFVAWAAKRKKRK